MVRARREDQKLHVKDLQECEELAESAARDLREQLISCGYPARHPGDGRDRGSGDLLHDRGGRGMSGMPPAVRAEAQRILNGAARRLLAERLDGDSVIPASGRDVDALDDRADEGTALLEVEQIPVPARTVIEGTVAARRSSTRLCAASRASRNSSRRSRGLLILQTGEHVHRSAQGLVGAGEFVLGLGDPVIERGAAVNITEQLLHRSGDGLLYGRSRDRDALRTVTEWEGNGSEVPLAVWS